jgi:hypothetical protein
VIGSALFCSMALSALVVGRVPPNCSFAFSIISATVPLTTPADMLVPLR